MNRARMHSEGDVWLRSPESRDPCCGLRIGEVALFGVRGGVISPGSTGRVTDTIANQAFKPALLPRKERTTPLWAPSLPQQLARAVSPVGPRGRPGTGQTGRIAGGSSSSITSSSTARIVDIDFEGSGDVYDALHVRRVTFFRRFGSTTGTTDETRGTIRNPARALGTIDWQPFLGVRALCGRFSN